MIVRRDTTRVIADSEQFLECTLDCPISWDGFSITACFMKGVVPSTVVDVSKNNAFKVPSFPLGGEGIMHVSFEAVKDGFITITTNAIPITVYPSGTGSITLPIPTIETPNPYAQYVAIVQAERAAIEAIHQQMPKRYSQLIGDGIASEFVVTHGLGTQDVTASIRNNTSPFEVVLCEIENSTEDTLRLMFSKILTLNEYKVTIVG